MKKLLNTLYVTSPDAYLSLDGENIVVRMDSVEAGRVPLHNLENIVTFGRQGVSPALMHHACGLGKGLAFFLRTGVFSVASRVRSAETSFCAGNSTA